MARRTDGSVGVVWVLEGRIVLVMLVWVGVLEGGGGEEANGVLEAFYAYSSVPVKSIIFASPGTIDLCPVAVNRYCVRLQHGTSSLCIVKVKCHTPAAIACQVNSSLVMPPISCELFVRRNLQYTE